MSPSARCKRQPNEVTLRYLLSTQVKPGDSRKHVVTLLGEGKPDDGRHFRTLLKYPASPQFDKRQLTDGVSESDEYIFYSALPGSAYDLQFRDDRLVNFDPSNYIGKNMLLDHLGGP